MSLFADRCSEVRIVYHAALLEAEVSANLLKTVSSPFGNLLVKKTIIDQ